MTLEEYIKQNKPDMVIKNKNGEIIIINYKTKNSTERV